MSILINRDTKVLVQGITSELGKNLTEKMVREGTNIVGGVTPGKGGEWMLDGKMKPCDYHTLASLYEIYPASCDKDPAPLGEWNSSKIISKNGKVEHWLNGKLLLSYMRFSEDFKQRRSKSKFRDYSDFGQIPEGHILIQDHGSEVHYRNILIKQL